MNLIITVSGLNVQILQLLRMVVPTLYLHKRKKNFDDSMLPVL